MTTRSDPAAAPTVAVAGLSARWLAEAAAEAGWRVIALDLFGDLDTRRLAQAWHPIGRPGRFRIDAAMLREGLAAARDAGACGWIGGSGLEAEPDLLEAGGPRLPRWGMDAAAVARLRTPAVFFDTLARLGLAHPPLAWEAPAEPAGWLYKRASGCGGAEVRPAVGITRRHADGYFQRLVPGSSMSALCLADGRRACLVGLQRQASRALRPGLPHVFAGIAGPVPDDALAQQVEAALAQLTPAFGLRGLLSLDFILAEGRLLWLEINPRPSASMQLHRQAWPGGLLAAHREALAGRLPATPPQRDGYWHGVDTVFAERDGHLPLAAASRLAADPACCDLPAPGSRFAAGDPVCSLRARAPSAEALSAALRPAHSAVSALITPRVRPPVAEETCP